MPNPDPTEPTFQAWFGAGSYQDIDYWHIAKNAYDTNATNLLPESIRWNFVARDENYTHESWLAFLNRAYVFQGSSPVREIEITAPEYSYEIADDGETYKIATYQIIIRQKANETLFPNPEDLR